MAAKMAKDLSLEKSIQKSRNQHPPRKVWSRVSTALVGGPESLGCNISTRVAPCGVCTALLIKGSVKATGKM